MIRLSEFALSIGENYSQSLECSHLIISQPTHNVYFGMVCSILDIQWIKKVDENLICKKPTKTISVFQFIVDFFRPATSLDAGIEIRKLILQISKEAGDIHDLIMRAKLRIPADCISTRKRRMLFNVSDIFQNFF